MNIGAATLVRAGPIAAALALWFWTQRLLAQRTPPPAGVGDRVHAWTAPLHARLSASPRAADALLIGSSAVIDLFGLYLLGAALLGPTFRPFVALLALYALRQLCQGICSLPAPPGTIWRHPGFPSLLVTYGTDGDYFFSGHTAIAVLGAIALAHAGPAWLGAAAWALAAAEAATVLVLRAHYTMDVVAAGCAAWCAWAFGGAVAPAVDRWLALVR
jgi:membrane-associated phospholipid phosphatase